jgi:hypothetical protein
VGQHARESTCCGVDKDAQTGRSGTEGLEPTRESQNTQSLELRFRALLEEGASEIQLALS